LRDSLKKKIGITNGNQKILIRML